MLRVFFFFGTRFHVLLGFKISFFETASLWFSSTESAQVEKPAAALASQSQSSSGSGSLNPSSGPPGSSASTVPVSPVLQSPAPPLLQDPNLLRQLLPALQTALQLNNASVDMAKINEGKRKQRFKIHMTHSACRDDKLVAETVIDGYGETLKL